MKRLIALTFVCLLFFLFHQASLADTWHTVRWVSDGDTVVLDNGQKVRYIGINAPEVAHDDHIAEPYGEEAKRFNASLVNRKKVRLEFDKERTDRYKRRLAYVFLKNGTFVNDTPLEPNTSHYLREGDQIRFGDQLFTLR